jgi:hypothetical protein
MKTPEELESYNKIYTFAEGYGKCLLASHVTLKGIDDWVVWNGYDINLAGSDYSSYAENDHQLRVDAYKAGWTDSIGDPIYSITVQI